jgi:hypothetical protein
MRQAGSPESENLRPRWIPETSRLPDELKKSWTEKEMSRGNFLLDILYRGGKIKPCTPVIEKWNSETMADSMVSAVAGKQDCVLLKCPPGTGFSPPVPPAVTRWPGKPAGSRRFRCVS